MSLSDIRLNKIACIGAGYVGGPTMAVMAHQCPDIDITVVDLDKERIRRWNSDDIPIYEPGLYPLIKECRGRNLRFTTDLKKTIEDCDIIFIAVNTPTKKIGVNSGKSSDLFFWENCSRDIAKYSHSPKIIVEKSTVPVKTADAVARILKSNERENVFFTICSNPEFLAEGTAIKDLLSPDRILIGANEDESGYFAQQALSNIYSRWVPEEKIISTNLWSSELAKLAANAFLAQRISSINSISQICEKTGASVQQVAHAVGLDNRVGSKFLQASLGFGGSCFKKDVVSLIYLAETLMLPEVASYWNAVLHFNDYQKKTFCNNIIKNLFDNVRGKSIAMLGMAFKQNTGDVRESPGIHVAHQLLNEGAVIHLYDPKVKLCDVRNEYFAHYGAPQDVVTFEKNLILHENVYEIFENAHCVVVVTEWEEFKTINFKQAYERMLKPALVFDGRNILDHYKLFHIGFDVHRIGNSPLLH